MKKLIEKIKTIFKHNNKLKEIEEHVDTLINKITELIEKINKGGDK